MGLSAFCVSRAFIHMCIAIKVKNEEDKEFVSTPMYGETGGQKN